MNYQGFTPFVYTTTAVTVVKAAGGNYVCARLSPNTASATLKIWNVAAASSTAAASLVATLNGVSHVPDELNVPVRCDKGVTIKLSANTGTAYIYIA